MQTALVKNVRSSAVKRRPLVARQKPNRQELRGRDKTGDTLAYDHLTPFCCKVDDQQAANYQAAHLVLIADALEKVEAGEIKRLMIFLPPGHWKSSLATGKFPAWYIGRNPKGQVLSICNDDELALDSSRANRDLIQNSEEYAEIFPGVALAEGQRSLKQWGVEGCYKYTFRAVGMQGGVTGRRGDIILIDNPVKNQQQVATKGQRDKLETTYKRDIYSRLAPNGAIVLIMTRWHEDDLAGRLIRDMKAGEGDEWEIICLPAIAEPGRREAWHDKQGEAAKVSLDAAGEAQAASSDKGGQEAISEDMAVHAPIISPSITDAIDAIGRKAGEALWPDRYDLTALEAKKKASGSLAWAALYQQRPRLEEGSLLKSGLLRRISIADVPKLIKVYRFWDLAFSDKEKADFCCGTLGGVDREGNFYIVNQKRIKEQWPKSKPIIIQRARDDGPRVRCAIEANGTQLGYYQDIKADARMRGRTVISQKPEGDKESRAALWGSRLIDGIVMIVVGDDGELTGWQQELFDEMDSFPGAPHDDTVDSVSGLWALCIDTPFGGMYSA